MSDYLRWLNTRGPVTKDTSSRLAQRWNSVTPVSSISKVASQIIIPAFNYTSVIDFIFSSPWQAAQFNYTAPAPFTITDKQFGNIVGQIRIFFAIRYRIGITMYRYVFPNIYGSIEEIGKLYTGQVIQPNFSIEVFMNSGSGSGNIIFTGGFFNTSILSNPISLPASQPSINPVGGLVTSLTKSLPVHLPYAWGQQAEWLSN